ncbi:TPA: ead/Ea22-like family protein [Escherichia coli]|uniref:ead/Ea22-like family protein n=2 Tax=Escherichia coli TaxID=562 RepID=UPI0007A5F9C6|nr:ead/Ea22-like family protein [Escherichia coli]HBE5195189.1 ead/Ea22-like family protein [Escherichia coli]HCJ5603454.1 ead/Ea22-like family protein [Escherichia coli]HCJ8957521.1 ead/Ea22-like family protein [Escherichia coli]HDW1979373.1 ead/Ea22-like family protein [Escherichia coli]
MSKIDYQALRAKAEKATCGEWSLEYGDGRFDGDDALIHREAAGYIPICRIEGAHPESGFDEDFQIEQQANAEFIAAANPATVLALLDELERNQQYIKRRDQENEDIALTVGKLRVELETAKKRIAELEAEPVSQTCKLNEPSGNSPVIPDGWISCSERMPEKNQNVLISVNFDSDLVEPLICSARYTGSTFRRGEATIKPGNGIEQATHWMPLPEPPQEVNRG